MGSSSSNTLAAEDTSPASASRVFSPPESTLADLWASSPEKRNEPSTLRASLSVSCGAALCMFSSTVREVSRVSCSWA